LNRASPISTARSKDLRFSSASSSVDSASSTPMNWEATWKIRLRSSSATCERATAVASFAARMRLPRFPPRSKR